MSKFCHKCGYTRQITDDGLDYVCPRCGAIYAKIEADLGIFKESGDQVFGHGGRKTKDCPYCGNEILASARKCRYCKSDMGIKASHKLKGSHYFGLTLKKIILIAIFIVILVIYAPVLNLEKYWAIAIGPFDERPSMSLLTSTDPEKRKKMCNWTKREYLRSPSSAIKSVRDGICEHEDD